MVLVQSLDVRRVERARITMHHLIGAATLFLAAVCVIAFLHLLVTSLMWVYRVIRSSLGKSA